MLLPAIGVATWGANCAVEVATVAGVNVAVLNASTDASAAPAATDAPSAVSEAATPASAGAADSETAAAASDAAVAAIAAACSSSTAFYLIGNTEESMCENIKSADFYTMALPLNLGQSYSQTAALIAHLKMLPEVLNQLRLRSATLSDQANALLKHKIVAVGDVPANNNNAAFLA